MKNTIYTIIIVACIVLAALVFVLTRGGSGGIDSLKRGELIWVKCKNKSCNAEYQMDNKDYHEALQEKMKANPMMMTLPLTCKKCGKDSVFKAVKCEKCGTVFFEGAAGLDDFSDRCPKCGHSATEALRKERKAQQGG